MERTIKYRLIDNPATCRMYGWTKRHRLFEVFVVGKWRTIAVVMPNNIRFDEIRKRILANTGWAKETIITFVKQEEQ